MLSPWLCQLMLAWWDRKIYLIAQSSALKPWNMALDEWPLVPLAAGGRASYIRLCDDVFWLMHPSIRIIFLEKNWVVEYTFLGRMKADVHIWISIRMIFPLIRDFLLFCKIIVLHKWVTTGWIMLMYEQLFFKILWCSKEKWHFSSSLSIRHSLDLII